MQFRIYTEGTAREQYLVEAPNKAAAQRMFERGEVTKPVVSEVEASEVTRIEYSGGGEEVETTSWLVRASLDGYGSSDIARFKEETEDRAVEEVRGYAFPCAWEVKHDDRGKLVWECVFEVQARERSTQGYVDEVYNALLTYFHNDQRIFQLDSEGEPLPDGEFEPSYGVGALY